jgi:hypothetical protein
VIGISRNAGVTSFNVVGASFFVPFPFGETEIKYTVCGDMVDFFSEKQSKYRNCLNFSRKGFEG